MDGRENYHRTRQLREGCKMVPALCRCVLLEHGRDRNIVPGPGLMGRIMTRRLGLVWAFGVDEIEGK